MITPAVVRLRKQLGLPGHGRPAVGVRRRRAATRTRLENHEEQSVVYTSTHDNDTARGWFESLPKRERDATRLDPREPHWSLIELAHASRAALSIVPAQDVLGLGSDGADEHARARPRATGAGACGAAS